MRKLLFDTNIFRDVQRGKITDARIRDAAAKIASSNCAALVSPLTLIELGSHINEEESLYFASYRDAFKAIEKLCTAAIEDPEIVLRKHVFGLEPDAGLPPADTWEIIKLVSSADTFEALTQPRLVMWKGTLAKVAFNESFLQGFRSDYERDYVDAMVEHVLNSITPGHADKRAKGVMANIEDPDKRAAFTSFVESKDFASFLVYGQALRVDAPPPDDSATKVMLSVLDAFITAYRWVLTKIAEAGYNPIKNKNDYNDLQFLLYLADPAVILISEDGGMSRKLAASTSQAARVLSFEEWLTQT